MPTLAIQIVRFVDSWQPGFVECEFVDSYGRLHTLFDKVPIFSTEELDDDSVYPQPGIVACEVLERWSDEQGRELVRVTTERPYAIESREGIAEFVVLAHQLVAAAGRQA